MIKRVLFLSTVVIILLVPGFIFAGTIQLPLTGQSKCYDTNGNEIACTNTGQDGDVRTGVAWPNQRFTVTYCNDTGPCASQTADCDSNASTDVITDNLTGLMWARNGNLAGSMTWTNALTYANNLTLCGYSDWCMPNINEMLSLGHFGEADISAWLNSQGFTNVGTSFYWSSTTDAYTNGAWVIQMADLYMNGQISKSSNSKLFPVRAGQQDNPDSTYKANIWKTGQSISYATGDDGDLKRGVAWPSPRFVNHGDETVTDNLSGLMWTIDSKSPGPAPCNPGITKTWQNALDHIQCLNNNSYLGYSDWRQPNSKELLSLTDYTMYNPALPSGHPFNVLGTGNYWSSTTDTYDTGSYSYLYAAWQYDMTFGEIWTVTKSSSSSYVWPVRSGEVFTDVSWSHWAYHYINAIFSNNITVGCVQDNINTPENERQYCPGTNVTRGEMAAFIIRAKYGENFTYTQTPYFSDVPTTHVFFKYVQKLKDEGITAVTGTYNVDSEVTRDQMAAFLARAFLGME
jgi:hypothetical protein